MRIEYADLVLMGATDAQLDTYSNSDPLKITRDEQGAYKITGIIEADGLDASGVLDILDALASPDC